MLKNIRSTKYDKKLGSIRIFVGIIFFSTGVMKLLVPMLWNAWAGQLTQAKLPLYAFNLWFVPFAEIITGIMLAIGFFSRVASLVVMIMMSVAAYAHLVVTDPALFPLQPKEPIIPIVVIVMGVYILIRGSGAWSFDLNSVK